MKKNIFTRGGGMNRTAVVMGALFFLVGLVFVVGSWGAYHLDKRIEKDGGRAIGQVIKKTFLFSSDGDSDYVLNYLFALPSGQRMNAQSTVPKKLWSSLNEGDSFVVLYNPEHPSRNFPLGGGVTSLGVTVFTSVIGVVSLVFGSLVLVGGIWRKDVADNRISPYRK